VKHDGEGMPLHLNLDLNIASGDRHRVAAVVFDALRPGRKQYGENVTFPLVSDINHPPAPIRPVDDERHGLLNNAIGVKMRGSQIRKLDPLSVRNTLFDRHEIEKVMGHRNLPATQQRDANTRFESRAQTREFDLSVTLSGLRPCLPGALAGSPCGMTTMQRLRSGGTQRVILQHVTVSEGGQAVVAGQVGTGGPAPGGRSRRWRGCFEMKDDEASFAAQ
jgi:hypothetical protein